MRLRSIPACTGEPVCKPRRQIRHSVGLSPRVRGNHWCERAHGEPPGSIPACTGEPRRTLSASGEVRVYPRVYGGTRHATRWHSLAQGLSPRVRGNPALCPDIRTDSGSIPACTGEPLHPNLDLIGREVYPRVYGGTGEGLHEHLTGEGLSPRVRGNLGRHPPRYYRVGSIPACTGEPGCQRDIKHPRAVYPRVYGGT